MSLLRRAARRFRLGQYRYHAGDDLEGREYFETRDGNVPGRTKRFVRYPGKTRVEPYEYIGETLPVSWESWLRHTRLDPPTLEELSADVARRQRVASNVAKLAEEYRLEKARQAQLAPSPPPPRLSQPSPSSPPPIFGPEPMKLPTETERRQAAAQRRAAAAQAREAESSPPPASSDMAPASTLGGDTFVPQAWAPRARRRSASSSS